MKQMMNILVCSRLFYPFPNSFVINAMENQINFLSLSSAVKNAISSTETWLWVCIFKQFGSPAMTLWRDLTEAFLWLPELIQRQRELHAQSKFRQPSKSKFPPEELTKREECLNFI